MRRQMEHFKYFNPGSKSPEEWDEIIDAFYSCRLKTKAFPFC